MGGKKITSFLDQNPQLCIICTSLQKNQADDEWAKKNLLAIISHFAGLIEVSDMKDYLLRMEKKGFSYHILAEVPDNIIDSKSCDAHAKKYAEIVAPKLGPFNFQPLGTQDINKRTGMIRLCFFLKP